MITTLLWTSGSVSRAPGHSDSRVLFVAVSFSPSHAHHPDHQEQLTAGAGIIQTEGSGDCVSSRDLGPKSGGRERPELVPSI